MAEAIHKLEEVSLCMHPMQQAPGGWQLYGNGAAPLQRGTSARSKDMAEAIHKLEEVSLCMHPMQQAPGGWQLYCAGILHRPDPQACPAHHCCQQPRTMTMMTPNGVRKHLNAGWPA